MNGHIIGFRPQTQTLESPYKPPSSTMAVKGLIIRVKVRQKEAKQNNNPVCSIKAFTVFNFAYQFTPWPQQDDGFVHYIVSQNHGHIFIICKVKSAPGAQAPREGDLGTSPESSETQFSS